MDQISRRPIDSSNHTIVENFNLLPKEQSRIDCWPMYTCRTPMATWGLRYVGDVGAFIEVPLFSEDYRVWER